MTVVRLGDVAQVIAGQSPPGDTYNQTGHGLPFFQGKADFGPTHPVARVWCTQPERVAEAGDILVSVRAPVGPTNVADARCCIGRGLVAVRPGRATDPAFLAWFMRSQERLLASRGQGSTFSSITRREIEDLKIPMPDLGTQRRIAAKFSAELHATEHSRHALRASEAPALALRRRAFDLAFVPRADGHHVRLRDVADLIRGVTFDGDEASASPGAGLAPILRAGNIGATLKVDTDLVWVPAHRVSSDQRMLEGDIAICMSSGSPAVVGKSAALRGRFSGSVGAFCAIVRAKGVVSSAYLAAWLRSPAFMTWRDEQSRGASIQNLKLKALGDLNLLVPDVRTQAKMMGELNSRLDTLDALDSAIRSRREAIEELPAALLRRAFAGLVD